MLVAKLSRPIKNYLAHQFGKWLLSVRRKKINLRESRANGRRDLKMLIWELLLERKYAQNELKKLTSLSEAISAQKQAAIKFIGQRFSLDL